jgi:hypothetical protein
VVPSVRQLKIDIANAYVHSAGLLVIFVGKFVYVCAFVAFALFKYTFVK